MDACHASIFTSLGYQYGRINLRLLRINLVAVVMITIARIYSDPLTGMR
jgi:hypothetical protein